MFAFMVCVVTIFLAIYYMLFKKSLLDNIPGPKPVPIFGNALQLDKCNPHLTLHQMSKKYGGVFKLVLFNQPFIIVNDAASIYQVLIKQSAEFAGRPYSFRLGLLTENCSGLAMADAGPEQRACRKLVQNYLKQFGSGMKKIEDITMDATDDMMHLLLNENGCPINMHDMLFNCITDVIAVMVNGETLGNDENITDIKQLLEDSVAIFDRNLQGELLDRFPFIRFLGIDLYQRIISLNEGKRNLFTKWITKKPVNGFISYLQSMSDHKTNALLDKHQIQMIFEFFSAVVITSSSTLSTLVNVLAQRPEIQSKLREEVMKVIGSSRSPTMQDRENMPYHRATLLEIGRFASIVPLAVPHKAVNDTMLGVYHIPAETPILVNLWSMHHDEDLWEEPYTFNPERFLDDMGQLVEADHPNRKNTMPFGAGQRVCVGEILALSRMFLILSRLVQNFVIEPETTINAQPSMDPRDMILGIALLPKAYKVRLNPVN